MSKSALYLATAALAATVSTASAEPISNILKTRNETLERLEKTCFNSPKSEECYIAELRSLFSTLLGRDPAYIELNDAEQQQHLRDISDRLATQENMVLDKTQIITYADVNEAGQKLSVWLYKPKNTERFSYIGASKVSTGYPDPKPRKPATETKFETGTWVYSTNPTKSGVFGYRAAGTVNSKGIRGFGEKGNRVYDVGPMQTRRGWDNSNMTIRFMIHSTDPVLEEKFGSQASQGCLRIPKTLNRFFEFSWAFDAGYDTFSSSQSQRFRSMVSGLLGPNPMFSSISGSILILGNSGQK